MCCTFKIIHIFAYINKMIFTMKQPVRDISIVERQIDLAIRKNTPRVLARLQKELEELKEAKSKRVIVVPAPTPKINAKTYENAAGIAFYTDKKFKL